ncbi:GyrI-like domain-containing protein [Legionella fallonii]|uniref:Transcription activator, effector binding n=1 Tax=Legionella fallonii LLAP-10 TaxID=1212491 RepID=A0A098G8Y9_9GAMM|nr:GyrI-like domain-containing protein [Legionella fallonii]CEG57935.1 Transcription activator, effector binding [Legionella fallonii LLAP-10]
MNENKPDLVQINEFLVAGLSVRTINSDEFNPGKAKLSKLWDDFFSTNMANSIPYRTPNSPIFGVYSNYSSDASDFYTVTAGVNISQEMGDLEFNTVAIQSGDYLVFRDKGLIPEIVIRTWGRIWEYFADDNAPQRRFGTDFELYVSTDEIAIYIGINNSH